MLTEEETPSCAKCIYSNGPVCVKNAPNPRFPLIDDPEFDFCGDGLWVTSFEDGITTFEAIMELIERHNTDE